MSPFLENYRLQTDVGRNNEVIHMALSPDSIERGLERLRWLDERDRSGSSQPTTVVPAYSGPATAAPNPQESEKKDVPKPANPPEGEHEE